MIQKRGCAQSYTHGRQSAKKRNVDKANGYVYHLYVKYCNADCADQYVKAMKIVRC